MTERASPSDKGRDDERRREDELLAQPLEGLSLEQLEAREAVLKRRFEEIERAIDEGLRKLEKRSVPLVEGMIAYDDQIDAALREHDFGTASRIFDQLQARVARHDEEVEALGHLLKQGNRYFDAISHVQDYFKKKLNENIDRMKVEFEQLEGDTDNNDNVPN